MPIYQVTKAMIDKATDAMAADYGANIQELMAPLFGTQKHMRTLHDFLIEKEGNLFCGVVNGVFMAYLLACKYQNLAYAQIPEKEMMAAYTEGRQYEKYYALLDRDMPSSTGIQFIAGHPQFPLADYTYQTIWRRRYRESISSDLEAARIFGVCICLLYELHQAILEANEA